MWFGLPRLRDQVASALFLAMVPTCCYLPSGLIIPRKNTLFPTRQGAKVPKSMFLRYSALRQALFFIFIHLQSIQLFLIDCRNQKKVTKCPWFPKHNALLASHNLIQPSRRPPERPCESCWANEGLQGFAQPDGHRRCSTGSSSSPGQVVKAIQLVAPIPTILYLHIQYLPTSIYRYSICTWHARTETHTHIYIYNEYIYILWIFIYIIIYIYTCQGGTFKRLKLNWLIK